MSDVAATLPAAEVESDESAKSTDIDESTEIASRVAPLLATALLCASPSPDREHEVLRGLDELATNVALWAHFTAVLTSRLRAERVFHLLPIPVQDRLDPRPIHQERHVEGDLVSWTTTVRLTGVSAAASTEALAEPWSWWHSGRVRSFEKRETGVRFALRPAGVLSAWIDLELAAPRATTEPSPSGEHLAKTVVEARASGPFKGQGRYEMLDVSGGSVLRSIWRDVRSRGVRRFLPRRVAVFLHAAPECGELPLPLPAATGLVGLAEHLKQA